MCYKRYKALNYMKIFFNFIDLTNCSSCKEFKNKIKQKNIQFQYRKYLQLCTLTNINNDKLK